MALLIKGSLFLAFLLVSTQAGWVPAGSALFNFQDQMRELEEASLSLLGEASKASEGSREELMEEKGAEDALDPEVPSPKEEAEEADASLFNPFEGLAHNFFNIFRGVSSAGKPDWWNGPNVCPGQEIREEEDEKKEDEEETKGGIVFAGAAQFSSCQQSPNKFVCTTITHTKGKTKTSIVTYQCCPGFRRAEKKPGCVEFKTKPMLETADEMGGARFSSMVKSLGLAEKLEAGNFTLFAPTDKALASYEAGLVPENQIDTQQGRSKSDETNDVEVMVAKAERVEKEFVSNHMVPGLYESTDFRNNMVLTTEGNATLRINAFPGKRSPLVTVNCAPLVASDGISDSGVVHTIGRVLTPVTQTVFEILSQPKYSKFMKLLEENDLVSEIKGEAPVTVFALTNEALEAATLKKGCVKRVLKHHILPLAVCAEAASEGTVSAADLSGHWVQLAKRPAEGKDLEGSFEADHPTRLVVDGTVPVTLPDVVATNGVVHEVAAPIVPQSAKTVREVLEKSNHTRFLRLLEGNGLLDEVEALDGLTLFVPTDSALDDTTVARLISSGEIKDVLRYHIASDKRDDCELRDGLELKTLLEGKEVSIRTERDFLSSLLGTRGAPTAQCVPLTRLNGKVCNGLLHEVQRLMTPPRGSLYDLVQARPEFDAFRRVLNGTKLEGEMAAGLAGGATLLVPTSSALRMMGDANYDTLLKDKSLADQILRAHVLTRPVCCEEARRSGWPFVAGARTLSGSTVEVGQRRGGVAFAGVAVEECDLTAADGVAHLVSGVMLPAGQRKNTDIILKKPNSEIILTGF